MNHKISAINSSDSIKLSIWMETQDGNYEWINTPETTTLGGLVESLEAQHKEDNPDLKGKSLQIQLIHQGKNLMKEHGPDYPCTYLNNSEYPIKVTIQVEEKRETTEEERKDTESEC